MAANKDPVAAARSLVLGGAAIVAGGIAIAGTSNQSTGGAVIVAGWLLLVWAIHRFGRAHA